MVSLILGIFCIICAVANLISACKLRNARLNIQAVPKYVCACTHSSNQHRLNKPFACTACPSCQRYVGPLDPFMSEYDTKELEAAILRNDAELKTVSLPRPIAKNATYWTDPKTGDTWYRYNEI